MRWPGARVTMAFFQLLVDPSPERPIRFFFPRTRIVLTFTTLTL
jgi:hypothetical protein